MKNKLAAALLVAATVMAQVGVSYADDAAKSSGDNGPWTQNHPYAWGVTSFPLRLVTGTVGMGFGALSGSVKGVVKTERSFAEHTFGEADKNPLMVPVGLVGAVVAVPVGVVTGAPEESFKQAKAGYTWWNRY